MLAPSLPTQQGLILLSSRDATDQHTDCSGSTPIWGNQASKHTQDSQSTLQAPALRRLDAEQQAAS